MSFDIFKTAAGFINDLIPIAASSAIAFFIIDILRMSFRQKRRRIELEQVQGQFQKAREDAEAAHERLLEVLESSTVTVKSIATEVGPDLIKLIKDQDARIKELEAEIEILRRSSDG